ncbi:hypothetical protein BDFB_002399 [Asbolus verrucosus]|uniref:Uncharacterized protein n=1 Tax=Asbolus verrucosus TaxID=1661398 RepID=A0A482VBC3_ASBVE|nr:hypothetical protein BDFB_002399 [Asbolus verrucosus]
MARLVSYKVKDESTYSTFDKTDRNGEETVEEINGNESFNGGIMSFCCDCFKRCKFGSKETVSDDIEFAMVKYAQVLRLKRTSVFVEQYAIRVEKSSFILI